MGGSFQVVMSFLYLLVIRSHDRASAVCVDSLCTSTYTDQSHKAICRQHIGVCQ